jgi:hypothetical protein
MQGVMCRTRQLLLVWYELLCGTQFLYMYTLYLPAVCLLRLRTLRRLCSSALALCTVCRTHVVSVRFVPAQGSITPFFVSSLVGFWAVARGAGGSAFHFCVFLVRRSRRPLPPAARSRFGGGAPALRTHYELKQQAARGAKNIYKKCLCVCVVFYRLLHCYWRVLLSGTAACPSATHSTMHSTPRTSCSA